MRLSLVVAMALNRVIGIENKLPWQLPADLRNFRKITMGKPLLMGRKTYESIGRPLPGRENIIITRNRIYRQQGCEVFHSVEDALIHLKHHEEVMVIGGAAFYESLLPKATRLYLTLIQDVFEGDTFFPEFDPASWVETARQDIDDDEEVGFSYSFLILDKR
ncbi:MAG: type 3 dihydrofolate reductase [Pseudomonadota bacterium]